MGRPRETASTLQLITATTTDRRQPKDPIAHVVNLTVRADDRLLLTVVEAARRLEISRSLLYELIATGDIESIHVGRLHRVPADALIDYVNRQRPERPDRPPSGISSTL